MNGGEALLFGDINIDSFWPVVEFPKPGRDGIVDNVKFEVGGAILNSAVELDRLGMRVRLLGCVGEDIWAEQIFKELSKTHIALSSIQKVKNAITGINFTIVTPDGERTMFTHRGANVFLRPEMLDQSIFQNARILHMSGYALLEKPQSKSAWKAIELAKKYGFPISLDTGLEPVMKQPQDFHRLLKELTVCISGLEEMNLLLGTTTPEEGLEKLIEIGVCLAAIKLGKKGSLIATREHILYTPSFNVDTVDSTGAGDSFSAGVLYGWLNGFELEMTATLASALGALATTVYGAGFSLPSKDALVKFLCEETDYPAAFMAESAKQLVAHFRQSGKRIVE